MNHAMWLPMVEFLLSQIIASAGYWASTHPHCKISFSARQEFKQVCKKYWCKRWRVFKSVNHYMLWYKKVAITFYLQQGENETITKNTHTARKKYCQNLGITFSTITSEILALSLVIFHCQLANGHMNLHFMQCWRNGTRNWKFENNLSLFNQ